MSAFKFAPFRIAHQLQNWPSKYHSGVSDQQILWETLRFKAIWTFGQPSRKGLQQLHESEAKLFSFYRNFFEPRFALIFSTCLLASCKNAQLSWRQWKRNIADAAAPNSWHRIPEGSPAICSSTPTSSRYTRSRWWGLINGALARKQQAYALIISSIFNIHNALLISDAPQQHCFFFFTSKNSDWRS